MTNVEQHVIQKAAKQVAELDQCRGKGIHCIDWQSVLVGLSQSPFSERKEVLFMHCTQCGLAVRIPQTLC